MHGMVAYSSVALSAVFRPISIIALNENPAGAGMLHQTVTKPIYYCL
jgi:hypothetical protein